MDFCIKLASYVWRDKTCSNGSLVPALSAGVWLYVCLSLQDGDGDDGWSMA